MSAAEPTQLNTRPTEVVMIRLDQIVPREDQPRQLFRRDDQEALAADIAVNGVRDALAVRLLPNGQYDLLAGHRRRRAALAAHLEEVPCLVWQLTDAQADAFVVGDNLNRVDFCPWEEGAAYAMLQARHGLSAGEIGTKYGKSEAFVMARIALTALGEEARQAYLAAAVTVANLGLLAKLPNHPVNFADCGACGFRVNTDAGGYCPSCLSSLEGAEWQSGGNPQTVAVRAAKGKPSGTAEGIIKQIAAIYGFGPTPGQTILDLAVAVLSPEIVECKGRTERALAACVKEAQWTVDHRDLLEKLPGEQRAAIAASAETAIRALRVVQEAVSLQEVLM